MKKIFTFLVLLTFLAIPSHAQLNYHQGDVNGDGTIDISDVVSLVNMILNGGTTTTCPDNNHPHAIDLGLPSGTKWACCNVDAPSPEAYGGYFAWGETNMKLVNDWSTYIYCNGSDSTCHNIGSNIGGAKYDVAHEKWGGFWRMPSIEQFSELLDNCSSEWTLVNGIFGRKFTGKNGSIIFFPSAGFIEGSTLSLSERFGIYWSDTRDSFSGSRANYLLFSTSTPSINQNPRYAAIPVRPVNVVTLELSMSSINLTKDETVTLYVLVGSGNYSVVSNDVSIATVSIRDNSIVIAANNQGSTTITVIDLDTGLSCDIVVSVSRGYLSCPDNHHPHLIDLGLPSGTQWACCNVGANVPEGYGGYYAWGETDEKSDLYNWSTYIYCDGTDRTCYDLGSDIAGTEYDVAHIKWGGDWQMPTNTQRSELINNCTLEWITLNGITGGKFTGSNGGTIFLPAAGYRWIDHITNFGTQGAYWSSTRHSFYSFNAIGLYFSSGIGTYFGYRSYGQSVRPVIIN